MPRICIRLSWAVISNLITGEYVTTPKVIMREELPRAVYCFGYDPTDKQFKVLRVTWYAYPTEVFKLWSGRYHVLTLGTGDRNLLWRKIQCRTLHYPVYDNGICIDGVLFYTAMVDDKTDRMVCFNLRSEEFTFINFDTKIPRSWILINYKGKLCVSDYIYRSNNQLKFWVLEDAKKHKWSKHIYQLPIVLTNEVPVPVGPIGMTGSGEFVLCSVLRKNPFFIFYYNFKSNTIRRVRLEDPVFDGGFGVQTVHTLLNLEDVELM